MTVGEPGRPVGEDELHAYVDGQLDEARRGAVERHLGDNPADAARVADWVAGGAVLREALAAEMRGMVPGRLSVRRLWAERWARRWGMGRVAAAVALAVLAGGGAGWGLRGSDRPFGVSAIAHEGLVAHRLFTAAAVVPAGAWADPAYTERLVPPDLSAAGYAFQRRQVVATDEGAGSVFLYADRGGNRISVFVRPMHLVGMTAAMQPVRDAPGWAWATNGLGVSLISSAPFPALEGIAEGVRLGLHS